MKHLSVSERRLNRVLWALLWVALVYALFQHVLLTNVPERFPGGARLGDLGYDLAIAYAGAFTFYLLVVRVPLRRDRRNIYQYLAPLIDRVVGEAVGLMDSLNRAAKVDATRQNTLSNVEETCGKVTPNTPVSIMLVPTSTELDVKQGTVMDAIHDRITRTCAINREILSFTQYLASDLINHIAAVDSCTLFQGFGLHYNLYHSGRLRTDMSEWAKAIFDYLQLVDDVDNYRLENKLPTYSPPPELISGSEKRSDAVPLKRHMNT